jgi:hypothetical protein
VCVESEHHEGPYSASGESEESRVSHNSTTSWQRARVVTCATGISKQITSCMEAGH